MTIPKWTPYMLELKAKMEAEQARITALAAKLSAPAPTFVYGMKVEISERGYADLLARFEQAAYAARTQLLELSEQHTSFVEDIAGIVGLSAESDEDTLATAVRKLKDCT